IQPPEIRISALAVRRTREANLQKKEQILMPIPSSKWFPTTIQERAAWFDTFITIFAPAGPSLGFTAAEVLAMQEDAGDFAAIAATQAALDNFAAAFRQFRISVTEDPVGTPQPSFPAALWT